MFISHRSYAPALYSHYILSPGKMQVVFTKNCRQNANSFKTIYLPIPVLCILCENLV